MLQRLAFAIFLVGAGCAADSGSPGTGGTGGAGGGTGGSGGSMPGTPPVRSCDTIVSYQPQGRVGGVAVAGEWNQWMPTAQPMTGPDTHGAYSAKLTLPPGAYAYKFVVTDTGGAPTWMLDPQNPYTKWVGGVENSVLEIDDCQVPALVFGKLDRSPSGTIHAEVQYVDAAARAGLDPQAISVELDGAPATGAMVSEGGLISLDATGLAKQKHRIIVHAADKAGHKATDLYVPFWIEDEDFDFRDGLLYFVFTDRFQNGDPSNDLPTPGVDPRANYQGGDFAGVKQAIDAGYFDSLGVRTIWLSPPNANPDGGYIGIGGHLYTGYHGYWPSSGTVTQGRFGDLAAFKALVAAAHAHGIRVIIDGVLNHVHQESSYWQLHQSDGWFNPFMLNGQSCQCGTGPADGCGDWNSGQPSGNHGFVPRLTCWFEPYLADFDYTSWDALTTSVDDALYWVREADIDGFRIDAVKHFLLTGMTRLRGKLHDQFEHAQPLFYLVGETFDGDRGLINSYIGPHALDAQFDFPLYFTLRAALADYSATMRDLEGSANASASAFGSAPMSPFLGNHDVARFISQAALMLSGDPNGQAWSNPPGPPPDDSAYQKLQMALTFVATSPGVPLIYYGDEYGQPGAGDPDNRRFMKWSGYTASEQNTIDLVKKLGTARQQLYALRRGNRVTMWVDDDLYVYARVASGQVAVVAINRQWNPRTVSVPVAPGVPLSNGMVLHDRLGGADVTVTGNALSLTIPAHSSAILAP